LGVKFESNGTGAKEVRLGIIGLGNMGTVHARSVMSGKVPRVWLAAVCDPRLPSGYGEAKPFTDPSALIRSGEVDAVLIATPHPSHMPIGIEALGNGLHVLVEKPIAVQKSDCEKFIAAHRGRERQVFAAMFNQRTDPFFQKIRALIKGGELGEIRRVSWTVTDWFRPAKYYASGSWRATWAGEGGGLLLNQCPHNLDLLQWLFGMPTSVRAYCGFGRYHDIEVEDDVTAYLRFQNGATGVFISSTGEAPGTNRLEIAAERGKIVHENDTLLFTRNEVEMSQFSKTAEGAFSAPPTWDVRFPMSGHGGYGEQHAGIMKNFANAILDGEPLIAPASEGIHSVELANAMIQSALTDKTVELPMNGKAYERRLKELIAGSKGKRSIKPGLVRAKRGK
jgi:predicted dehydrogenase